MNFPYKYPFQFFCYLSTLFPRKNIRSSHQSIDLILPIVSWDSMWEMAHGTIATMEAIIFRQYDEGSLTFENKP